MGAVKGHIVDVKASQHQRADSGCERSLSCSLSPPLYTHTYSHMLFHSDPWRPQKKHHSLLFLLAVKEQYLELTYKFRVRATGGSNVPEWKIKWSSPYSPSFHLTKIPSKAQAHLSIGCLPAHCFRAWTIMSKANVPQSAPRRVVLITINRRNSKVVEFGLYKWFYFSPILCCVTSLFLFKLSSWESHRAYWEL